MNKGRFWLELERLLAAGARPLEAGVHGYRAVARLRASLAAASALAAASSTAAGLALLALAAALAAAAAWAHRLYRSLAASGLEREAPALLAFLVPYSGTTSGLADVLASLASWRGRPFRWVSREAGRLAKRLRLTGDPLEALEWLASTTPSRTISTALGDYVNALRLGAPRVSVAQRLLDAALDSVRRSWSSYSSLARVASEAGAAVVVLVAALAPAAALASLDPALLAAPLAVPPAISLLIALGQPPLGAPSTGPLQRLYPMAVAGVAAAASLWPGSPPWAPLAVLAAGAAGVEAYAAKISRASSAAWKELARLIEEARVGVVEAERVSRASPAAPGVAEALARASRIAGTRGLARALEGVYRLLAEARHAASATAAQAWVMAAVSAGAVALAVYTMEALASIAGDGGGLVDTAVMEFIGGVVAAYAPLAPLPAAVAARPWAPTLLPSLAASLAVFVVSGVWPPRIWT